jgi:arylsulfatase A-like enzyme
MDTGIGGRNDATPREVTAANTAIPRGSVTDSVAIVFSIAMFMALGYVVEVAWRRFVLGGFVSASREVVWMAPLSAAAFAVVLLAPLWLAAPYLRRATARRWAAFGSVWLFVFAALLPWTQIHRLAAVVLAIGVAAMVVRWIDRGERLATIRRVGTVTGVFLLVVGGALSAWRAQQRRAAFDALPPAREGSPNVLVLLLDTVRASALSMYGYARNTSPSMDALAAGGLVFEHAVSTAPWTLPAHASLFTGEFPGLLSASFRRPLDGTRATLAEHFREGGYETVGFVGNPYYTAWDSGLSRGFLHWHDYNLGVRQVLRSGWIGQASITLQFLAARSLGDLVRAVRSAEFVVIPKPGGDAPNATQIADAMLAWERGRAAQPYFAFANFFDAHEAYAPPARYRTRFAADPGPRDLHDAEIAYIDDEVQRLLDGLRTRGALENTIVVITSDHGEQFKEHGINGHGNSLYYHLLHIPLVIRFDGRVPSGRRVSDVVSLRDVGATLLSLAELPSAATFPGHSLAPTWAGGDSTGTQRSPAISELTQDSVPRTSDPLTRSQGISLVENDGLHGIFRNTRSVRPLMYNVRTDTNELDNLSERPEGRAIYDAQRGRLRRLLEIDQAEFTRR